MQSPTLLHGLLGHADGQASGPRRAPGQAEARAPGTEEEPQAPLRDAQGEPFVPEVQTGAGRSWLAGIASLAFTS